MTDMATWQAAKTGARERAGAGAAAESRLSRLILIFLVTVQHSAFIYVPAFFSGREYDDLRGIDDPINAICVALSALLVAVLALSRPRAILQALARNPLLTAFMILVLASTLWSIHPDITIKRGVGYVVTMGVALLLVTMTDFLGAMRIFSTSFAIAAIGSLLFCLALPQYAIMSVGGDLSSTWRGVYTHKEVLGAAMAFAVVVECAIVLATRRLPLRRAALGLLFVFLAIMTRSAMAIIVSFFAIGATSIILSYAKSRFAGSLMLLSGLAVGLSGAYFAMIDAEMFLGFFGKDVGLTGRVELWQAVLDLIGQRPALGWGYRATWVPTDPEVQFVDHLTGGWGVGAAHNSFLEMALQLGLIGIGLLCIILLRAAWLAWVALRRGDSAAGASTFLLLAILLVAGQVYEMLGLNQNITWLIFLVLMIRLNQPRTASEPGRS